MINVILSSLKLLFIATFINIVAITGVGARTLESNLTDPCSGGASSSTYCESINSSSGTNGIVGADGILTVIAQVIVFITGAISIVMIIVGGLRYTTSGGDSNATKGAKDTIIYAIVGLVVAVFSQIIVTFVLSKL